jgi:subtilisin family serine protease
VAGRLGSRRAALAAGIGLVVALGAFAPATSGSHAGRDESLGATSIALAAKPAPKLDARLAARARTQPSVHVELVTVRRADAQALVSRLGGRVERSYGRLVDATVPSARLGALARDPAVRFAAEPLRPVPEAVRGEGVASTGAAAWHAAGLRGAGVRVAVIDLGFYGWRESRANGDLPASTVAVSFCPGALEFTDHGTAVAEIVAEMAPAARIFLVCAQTVAALGQAKDWAKRHGVQIVNHSASWFNSSRGDGTAPQDTPAGIVADARAAGILWVNAAGNRAQQHWSGTFADADHDGWHEFAPGDEGNTLMLPPGLRTCAALKWDAWPTTDTDYDLYLIRDSDGLTVASSTTVQTGTQPPTEELCYGNPVRGRAHTLAIRANQATATPRLDLFIYPGPDLEHQVAEGSVTEPGSSPSALTVGAACWQNDGLESFSSRGPTIDGRLKPDLTAPDFVSSFTYGRFGGCGGQSGFAGTSAASPHAAGAAALVKGGFPAFGPTELQQFLESHALDLGVPGRDASFGAGRLALGVPPRVALRACIVPALRGLRLAAAKAAIVHAFCSVGRVRRTRSRLRRGRVVAQTPRAGRTLALRARVNLIVSR